MNLLRKIMDLPYALSATAVAYAFTARTALADADVLNPIQQVEDAREAAQNTTLDVDSAKSGAEKFADVLIYFAAPLGLAVALFGFWMLHKANQDESGRTSKGVALTTIIIGGCTAVFSALTFVAVEYIVGTKS